MQELTTDGPYSISARPLNSLELAFTNWQLEQALDDVSELYPLLALMQGSQLGQEKL